MELLTAPVPTSKLLELFKDKDLVFDIDYPNSKLKGNVFIEYIANSKINCNLHGTETLSYEEKAELFDAWLDCMFAVEVFNFKELLAQILLNLPNTYFTLEETERFKQDSKSVLDDARQFFNSMIIMIPSIAVEFKEHILDADIKNGTIKEIDGREVITPNIYNLTFYPKFIDLFLGTVEEEYPLQYYKGVIENYFYKDKGFFELLTSEETAPNLIAIFNYFFNEEETQEQT